LLEGSENHDKYSTASIKKYGSFSIIFGTKTSLSSVTLPIYCSDHANNLDTILYGSKMSFSASFSKMTISIPDFGIVNASVDAIGVFAILQILPR
jgi:hypothetical protein